MRTIPFNGRELDWPDGPERIVDLGFLGDEGMRTFLRLIHLRRSLPVYRGPFWRCYECAFESVDLTTMATHIIRTHPAAPFDEDEETGLCECSDRLA